MDLDTAYATASLFTLALHDSWAASGELGESLPPDLLPWGVPLEPPDATHRAATTNSFPQQQQQQQQQGYSQSGWDFAAAGGLLEHAYACLGIPPRKWQGLKQLPLAACGGARTPMQIVRTFVGVLDVELATTLPEIPQRALEQQRAQQHQEQQSLSQQGMEDGCTDQGPVGEIPCSPTADWTGSGGGSSLESTPTARLVRDDLFERLWLSSSDDSDWEEDMRREELQYCFTAGVGPVVAAGGEDGQQKEEGHPGNSNCPACPGAIDVCAACQSNGEAEGQTTAPCSNSNSDIPLANSSSQQLPGPGATAPAAEGQESRLGTCGPAAAAAGAAGPTTPRPSLERPVSPHVLGALWELVQCCVGAKRPLDGQGTLAGQQWPERCAAGSPGEAAGGVTHSKEGEGPEQCCDTQPEAGPGCASDEQGASEAGESSADAGGPGVEGGQRPRLPQVRWYDARARVALKQVAAWLQVPWRNVANFELLLANEKAPANNEEAVTVAASKAGPSVWEQRLRWVKVGAAAVGGGALFAVTGGLAAPALAAGLSSVLAIAGPSTAAVAGVVSGFTASTVGVATVAGTLGAAGAARTGGGMAYRTAEVSEFGFRELAYKPASRSSGGVGAAVQPAGVDQPAPTGDSNACGPTGAANAADAGVGSRSGEGQQEGPTPNAAGPACPEAEGQGNKAAAQEPVAPADSGHLLCSPASMSGRASSRALRPSSSAGSLLENASATSSSNGSSPAKGASVAQHEPPGNSTAPTAAGSEPPASWASPPQGPSQGASSQAEPGAWQRWFGRKEEAPPLLPVPLRVRRGGDVRLAALICVSGWITEPSDYVSQWESVRAPDADIFCLVWESRELLALNSALGSLLTKQAASQGTQFAVQHFFYAGAGLVAALAPALLLDTASSLLIQNAWSVSLQRAAKAGKLLAHVLMGGGHGDRPVTLVGHSMGARLIFYALAELARHDCRGIVQDVVLLGTPVGAQPDLRWHMARRVVAGRLINAFSRRDWLLGVVFGGSSGWVRAAAGLCPVEVAGVENVNLSALVSGHFDYLGPQVQELFDSMALFD